MNLVTPLVVAHTGTYAGHMEPSQLDEYRRRRELREQRKAAVRKAAGWSDEPGNGLRHRIGMSASNEVATKAASKTKPPKGFQVVEGGKS